MDAVLADDVVTINLSHTESEIQVAANRFKEKSTDGVMTGCVGRVGRVNSILSVSDSQLAWTTHAPAILATIMCGGSKCAGCV